MAIDCMQNTRELFHGGHPQEAVAALLPGVRANPESAPLRMLLFQLYAVLGQWDRCENQLKIAVQLDAKLAYMEKVYLPAIRCHPVREAILAGTQPPVVLGEPPEWFGWIVRGNQLLASGKAKEGCALLRDARQAVAGITAMVNDVSGQGLCDADIRYGPVLEAIVNGVYYWIPITRVKEMTTEPPRQICDTLWLPCQFVWDNGGTAIGLLPTLYPGSAVSGDAELQLGHRTDWMEEDQGALVGAGQRILCLGGDEFAILDVRSLRQNLPEPAAAASSGS